MGDAEAEDQAPAASLVSQVVRTRGGLYSDLYKKAKSNKPGVVNSDLYKKQKALLSMFSNRSGTPLFS
jgi:hypothetical protein